MKTPQTRNNNRRGSRPALLLGAALLACAVGCGDKPSLTVTDAAPTHQKASLREQLEQMQGIAGIPEVPVLRLTPAPISEELSITGELVPRNSVIVKPLMDGRITFLRPIKVGDIVKKGDQIAKIDDRDIEDEIAWQQKQIDIGAEKLKLDEQSLTQSQKNLEFDRQLLKEGFLNENEFEKTEMSLRQAEIALRQSKIALEQEQSKLGKALRQREKVPIVAPIGGMVVLASHLTSEEKSSNLLNEEILSLEGMMVGTGTPLFGIVSQDGYLAQCLANGRDKAKLQEGQQTRVTVITHRPVEITGRLTKLSLLQDAKSHAYKIWIALDGMDPSFTSGLFVRANIQLARREGVLVVKKEYVKERNNRQFLQVIQGGVVKDRWVTTGLTQDDKVEIESGCKADEFLVASKEVFAAEQTVRPVEVREEDGEDGPGLKIMPEAGALPVVFKPRQPGGRPGVVFTLDGATTPSTAALRVRVTGPVKLGQLAVTVNNGTPLVTPEKIMHEGQSQSASYAVPAALLKEGKNQVWLRLNGDMNRMSQEVSIDTMELLLKD